jgi:N-acetylglucosamine-6-phosphate deacetylase
MKPTPARKAPLPTSARPPSPGFFDLQVNGFAGVDFQRVDLKDADYRQAIQGLWARQTNRILFTLITDSIDRLCLKLRRAESFRGRDRSGAKTFAGYHLEGPYLSPLPGFRGAHDASLMRPPSIREFDRLWTASGGNIRLITLAPELPGSPEFIRHAVSRGVRISIGHSNASDGDIDAAIEAGLTLGTHLGNAVPQRLHRHDNVMQRLLARDELYAAFIPDGFHLPPAVLRNFVRAKPVQRVLFTTDCMSAAHSPPGRYRVAHLEIEVGTDGVVRLPGHKRSFAGSSLTMDAAARNVQAMLGWSRAQAVAACSTRVAAYLGFN